MDGFTIWLTGLSGAGKSTVARRLADALRERGRHVEVLDGDEVRENLSKGLGFSREDRDTNIRRIAYVAGLLTRSGSVAITAAISPYGATRAEARAIVGDERFVEVYVECPLDELIRRDVKGLYARAMRGEITNFTGISDPYEPPVRPDVVVHTDRETAYESAARILEHLETTGYLDPADGQIAPHGGRLINRVAQPEQAPQTRDRLPSLARVQLGQRALSHLDLLANGAYSPLTGFQGRADYLSVLTRMRLQSGLPWPIPITLGVSAVEADALVPGQDIALTDAFGRAVATLSLEEVYERDVDLESESVFRTLDLAHPGVNTLRSQGRVLLAGPVTVLERTHLPGLGRYALDPAETRRQFAARGWRSVVGFQTRNPVHRAHEYLQKCAMEVVDGLLLHPLVGETKGDDLPADIRFRCYLELLEHYYPTHRVLLAALPAPMHYAGPREAVLHALMRKNYGCTHFIVGRDHAGVGSYYGTYDAHSIFEQFAPRELGITPMFFDNAFYCRRCGGMATTRTCPHTGDVHVTLSGTRVREMLREGQPPPAEYSRPEVARLLVEAVSRSTANQLTDTAA